KAMATTPLSAKVLSVVALAGLAPVALNMAQRTRQGAPKTGPPFVDPTATVSANVRLGHLVYVAPFAEIKAGSSPARSIKIGNESDVQDSCVVTAEAGAVTLGDKVLVAHGGTIKGPASIGVTGRCPEGVSCPSFVVFIAEVAGPISKKTLWCCLWPESDPA